jgi:hypothetical protein
LVEARCTVDAVTPNQFGLGPGFDRHATGFVTAGSEWGHLYGELFTSFTSLQGQVSAQTNSSFSDTFLVDVPNSFGGCSQLTRRVSAPRVYDYRRCVLPAIDSMRLSVESNNAIVFVRFTIHVWSTIRCDGIFVCVSACGC